MASLTRKFLSALNVEADAQDQILDTYQAVLSEIKTERDEYKEKASKSDDLQKKLDEANEALKASDGDGFKSKYEDLKKEFDEFKTNTEAKALTEAKGLAYRQLLKDSGVSEKRIDSIMKLTDLNEIELDGDKLKDADKLTEAIKTEWSDFITSEGKEGAGTENPPAGEGNEQKKVNIPTIF